MKTIGGLIRVAVVEDHALVREGLVSLLREASDFEVVGAEASGDALLEVLATTPADVAVVDCFLGGGAQGPWLVKTLRQRWPALAILGVSQENALDVGERMVRAGASGFVSKSEGAETLRAAVRRVAEGRRWLEPLLVARLLEGWAGETSSGPEFADLSDREFEVLHLLGTGLGLDEIARRLGVSPRTIASHRENVRQKLQVPSSEEVARVARTWVRREFAVGRKAVWGE